MCGAQEVLRTPGYGNACLMGRRCGGAQVSAVSLWDRRASGLRPLIPIVTFPRRPLQVCSTEPPYS